MKLRFCVMRIPAIGYSQKNRKDGDYVPAPDSILIRSKERKPFAPVDKAIALYKKIYQLCIKMPRRYTYFGLQQTNELAGSVMDNAKMANSVFVDYKSEHPDIDIVLRDATRRLEYWKIAREYLQALSTRIDRFYDAKGTLTYHDAVSGKTKGITQKELDEVIDLIIEENNNLNNTIDREKKQLKDFKIKFNIV